MVKRQQKLSKESSRLWARHRTRHSISPDIMVNYRQVDFNFLHHLVWCFCSRRRTVDIIDVGTVEHEAFLKKGFIVDDQEWQNVKPADAGKKERSLKKRV